VTAMRNGSTSVVFIALEMFNKETRRQSDLSMDLCVASLQTVLRSAVLTVYVCWFTTTKDSYKHQQGVANKTRSVKTSGEAVLNDGI